MRLLIISLLLLLPCTAGLAANHKGAHKPVPAPSAEAPHEYSMADAQAACKDPSFIMPTVLTVGDQEAYLIFCVTRTNETPPQPTKWFYKLLAVVLPPSNNTPATSL